MFVEGIRISGVMDDKHWIIVTKPLCVLLTRVSKCGWWGEEGDLF